MDHFEYQSAQVGDRVYLTRRENDTIVRRCEWQSKLAKSFRQTAHSSEGSTAKKAQPTVSAAASVAQAVYGEECPSGVDSESSMDTATTGSDHFLTASEDNSDAGGLSSSPNKTHMASSANETSASASRHLSFASRVRRTLAMRGGRRGAFLQSVLVSASF